MDHNTSPAPVDFNDPDITIPPFGGANATEGVETSEEAVVAELGATHEEPILDAAQRHEIEQAAITALSGDDADDEPIAAVEEIEETDVFAGALGSLKNTLADALGKLEELSVVKEVATEQTALASARQQELDREDKAVAETVTRLRLMADDLEEEHRERQRLRRGYEG